MEKKDLQSNINEFFKQYWILGLILITTILTYLPVFNAGFVNLDDNGYVYENPDIISTGTGSVTHFFTRFYVGHYLPLTMLFLKIDYLLFGLNASGYHFMNLILHLMNSFLVYILIQRLFKSKITAIIVTTLFALHPMHVESVAWISERKDVLYTFFLLLSSIYYVSYISADTSRRLYYYSLAAFLLALLSKSAAVIFPFLLLLIDLFVYKKLQRKLIFEKLPFFAISIFFAILTLYSQDVGGKGSEVFERFSGMDKFFFSFYAFGFYILKMFIPLNLSVFHPFPVIQSTSLHHSFYPTILIAVISFAYLIWLTYRSIKSKTISIYLFGMLFYLISISLYLYLPVGRVVVAERFSYFSYIGLFLLIASFVTWLISIYNSRKIRAVILTIFCMIALMLAFLSYERAMVWKNGISLWANVLSIYPADPVANKSIADAFSTNKNYYKALAYYKKAILYDFKYTEAYYNMGNINLENGYVIQAVTDFTKALELNPNLTDGYISRGNAKARIRDFDGAISDYSLAIMKNISKTEAYVNRGSSWYLLNNLNNACYDWRIAASLGSEQAKEMLSNYCR